MDTEMLFGNLDNELASMQYRDFKARDTVNILKRLLGMYRTKINMK